MQISVQLRRFVSINQPSQLIDSAKFYEMYFATDFQRDLQRLSRPDKPAVLLTIGTMAHQLQVSLRLVPVPIL